MCVCVCVCDVSLATASTTTRTTSVCVLEGGRCVCEEQEEGAECLCGCLFVFALNRELGRYGSVSLQRHCVGARCDGHVPAGVPVVCGCVREVV